MPNTRAFCDQENHEHAIVPAIVDVRDNLGTLAVQVLAAMLNKLYQIVSDLHTEYDHHKPTEYTGG